MSRRYHLAMSKQVDTLYRAAIEKLAKSADPEIERLRRAVSLGEGIPLEPEPGTLAAAAGKDASWGDYAFSELRSYGFIRTHILKFVWYRPTETQISEEQAALAGIEAMAIVRLSSMDCAPAMPEIRKRCQALQRIGRAGKPLAALLAHQKMMLAIVAATGETHVLEEYAKRASVALIYARSLNLEARHIEGMMQSAATMFGHLSEHDARHCAAAAAGMRVHPSIPVAIAPTAG